MGQQVRAINGAAVDHSLQVGQVMWKLKAGDKVKLDLDGAGPLEIAVRDMTDEQLIRQRLALQLQELTPALQKALGLPAEKVPHNEFLATTKQYGNFELRLKLKLTGSIDRVDTSPDGIKRVVDYKTGAVSHFRNETYR